jgi:hypothetical protein
MRRTAELERASTFSSQFIHRAQLGSAIEICRIWLTDLAHRMLLKRAEIFRRKKAFSSGAIILR